MMVYNNGNCHPSKTSVNLGFASADSSFLGVRKLPTLPSRAVNIYVIYFPLHQFLAYTYIQPFVRVYINF